MSWWNYAQMENFEDRNVANEKIQELSSLAELLSYAAKLIYQTARGARNMVAQVGKSKILSSYPMIRDILSKADRIAIDSPHKFADYCKEASSRLKEVIVDLEEEREEFTKGKLPNRIKGFTDDE